MKHLIIILFFMSIAANCVAAIDEDLCLGSLATFEFGEKSKDLVRKKIAQPISVTNNGKYYVWTGQEISESNGPAPRNLGSGQRPQPSIPEQKFRTIWTLENGRIDGSFPSDNLVLIKEKLITNSFFSALKARPTAQNVDMLWSTFLNCRTLAIKVRQDGKQTTVGTLASEKIEELKLEFPALAARPQHQSGPVAR